MTLIRAVLVTFATVPAAVGADGSTDDKLVKDMVVLDKAYVAALIVTGQGGAAHSRIAVDRLVESWEGFRSKWNGVVDEVWRTGFVRIGQVVAESSRNLSTEKDLKHAHRLLDEFRHILWGLRKSAGILYFPDYLTAFDDALEELVLSVVKDKHETMTSDELDIAENVLYEAARRWKIVAESPLDKIVYRIDHYSVGEMSYYRGGGTVLFEKLTGGNLRTEDRLVLADQVEQLARNFQSLLRLFGEFRGLEGDVSP